MEAASLSQSKAEGRFRRLSPVYLSTGMALAAGLLLRVWFYLRLARIDGDALVYGDIAKNLLLHGKYALISPQGLPVSTLIRLPGYPLLMAACFRLFGIENYAVIAWLQIALDLVACLLLAGFVRRIASPRAALCTLWLVALCPFTAIYAGKQLTEALTLFCISLALWALAGFANRPAWTRAILFSLAVMAAAMLRPDGPLLGLALTPPLLLAFIRQRQRIRRPLLLALTCLLIVLAPFAAWTWRNARTLHVFQPLAPRLANDPGVDPNLGWEKWVKTWSLDFITTYKIYWPVPGERFDAIWLPLRAFDSPAERLQTQAIIDDYNRGGFQITHELDLRFEQLAEQRIHARPLRYYLWLPMGRMADMWFRPRNENMYSEGLWWRLDQPYNHLFTDWALMALNLAYLLLALAAARLRPRFYGWMLLYFALRSALLLTVQAPEPRYTLECFPMLLALSGIALDAWLARRQVQNKAALPS